MASRAESLVHARMLLEKYHSADISLDVVRPEIRDSWRRCLESGLEPDGKPKQERLTEAEIRDIRRKNDRLIHLAKIEMKRLHSQISDGDHVIAFADPHAALLEVLFHKRTANIWAGVAPGLRLDERFCGTNALGTAAFCRQPIIVHALEHFFHSSGNTSCTASPVMDPDGDVVGIIDISSDCRCQWRQMRELVSMSALNIEAGLFRDRFGANVVLQFHRREEFTNTLDAALIALNDEGEVLGCNSRARFYLQDLPFQSGHHFNEVFQVPFRNFIGNTSGQHTSSKLADLNGSCFSVMVYRPHNTSVRAESLPELPDFPSLNFVCKDSAAVAAVLTVKRAVQVSAPVLIRGETGTGKEVLAEYSHRLTRRRGRLISVNCAALPADLIEAELFGYCDGAFTGARPGGYPGLIKLADHGTLFLDEIGDLPLSLQPVLLQFLDHWTVRALGSTAEHKVDIQLITATSCAIEEAVAERRFRADLRHRISAVEVFLPPLRERSDFRDIVSFLLNQIKPGITIQEEGLRLLEVQKWEGNIRELKNILIRLIIASSDVVIYADEVESILGNRYRPESAKSAEVEPTTPVFLSTIHENAVLNVHRKFGGDVSKTARQLSISRNTVYRVLRRSKQFLHT
jgi:sigma-54 dependent transcriptional regulator, acetoin dehydrogenase operon transcriptional activator AcoR